MGHDQRIKTLKGRKPKDYGKTKSLDDLLEEEKRSVRRGLSKRNIPKNNFLFFSPAKPDSLNPMGLNLTKDDCKIVNGVQRFGYHPPGEFCKLIKMKPYKFYERLKGSPDLIEALRFIGFTPLLMSFPENMAILSKNFGKSKPWADLFCEVVGLKKKEQIRIVNESGLDVFGASPDNKYITDQRIRELLGDDE